MRNIITHNGTFHADDIFATAILHLIWPLAIIMRRNPSEHELADPETAVLDIGGIYDPALLCFDHHQPIGSEGDKAPRPCHPNSGTMAAFGLVWTSFGQQLIQRLNPTTEIDRVEETHRRVAGALVKFVDAEDTGTPRDGFTVSKMIARLNNGPEANRGQRFMEAVQLAIGILQREITWQMELTDNSRVKTAIQNIRNPHILELEQFDPWKQVAVDEPEIWFATYPSNREGWVVECCPPPGNPMGQKKPLPEWLATDTTQREALGCGIIFAHTNRFLAVCDTRENAGKLAEWLVEINSQAA